MGGRSGPEFGIDTWATGKKGNGLAGTWVDAEDGVLGRNPIEQGSVDCTIGFELGSAAAGESRKVTHWVCMGARLSEVSAYGQDLIIGRGPNVYYGRTRTYCQGWSEKVLPQIDETLAADRIERYRWVS